ncbi:MAG: RNA polymerase sigma factor [bacterium]|nr:RNA polymerase sigma factor [bacterium]
MAALAYNDDFLQIVASGDHEAYQELWQVLEPLLRRFVRRLIGHAEAVDDVMQDVSIALYHNLHRIKPIENIRPYAFGVARNFCYEELRRQQRRPTMQMDEEEIDRAQVSEREALDDDAEWMALYKEVQQAIDRLPEPHRQTMILFYEEEFSQAEIALMMNTSVGTVKSRLHYARRALKGLLSPDTLSTLNIAFGRRKNHE